MAKKVRGVGINDSDQPVHFITNGTRTMCPYYRVWSNMLDRCYGPVKLHGYALVSVCEEWLTFSNFKSWMEAQDWRGKQLDKDILSKGENKTYSPTTSLFISKELNNFIIRSSSGSDCSVGFERGKWRAKCGREHVGMFDTREDAVRAYRAAKINKLAMLPDSEEIKNLILERWNEY